MTKPIEKSRPTLDMVARLAGVSRATASRAMNGGQRVSPRAKQAVDQAVSILGYVPNSAARALATCRSGSVALVIAGGDENIYSDPFFAEILRGTSAALERQDMHPVLLFGAAGSLTPRTIRYLSAQHVDGAVVYYHYRDDGLVDQLGELDLPCVFGGRPWSHADRLSFVDVDNVAAEYEATKLLIGRGCTRIATVAGPAHSIAAEDRIAGWRQALEEERLPQSAVERGDFTDEGGMRAAQRLIASHPDLDGLVVASDVMALGALRALAHAGRRVPDDVAVVGFDDLGRGQGAHCTLTSVRQPVRELAETAVMVLLDRIASPERLVDPIHRLLPTRLVRRDSA